MTDKIVGRYRILDRLGEGGVGTVYMAIDNRLGRIVALKFLRHRLLESPQTRCRFRREALIAAALNHPNICTIYDIDEHRGRPYIVMEFLRGRPLSERFPGCFDTHSVLDVGLPLLHALAAAHARSVIHRDIKPANVFIVDNGHVKLLDFGVAKAAEFDEGHLRPDQTTNPGDDLDTGIGRFVGTVGYMSPEQARGETLDARSDIFSLGTLLYEIATDEQPFVGSTQAAVFERIFHADPPSLPCLNPALSPALVRVIDKALSKRRGARYQSAADMLVELEQIRPPSQRRGPRTTRLASISEFRPILSEDISSTVLDRSLPRRTVRREIESS
ncbi:MAG: serine/threonine protein kinase [Acidobacteria bacterium]|nr:serine/threonine protein kinase [Acidobacteriota bacterium]